MKGKSEQIMTIERKEGTKWRYISVGKRRNGEQRSKKGENGFNDDLDSSGGQNVTFSKEGI